MRTTLRVWDTVARKLGKPHAWSPHTLLWGIPRLPHFCSIPDPIIWARYGIMTLEDIVSQGQLITFDAIKWDRGLPNQMFFRYIQLRHAFRSQFPSPVSLEMSEVEDTLRSPDGVRTLSILYHKLAVLDTSKVSQLFLVWQWDVPDLTDDDWAEGIQQYLPLMISSQDRFIQLKFLHCAYYSPARLARIYPDRTFNCLNVARKTLIFIIWSGPVLV